MEKHTLGDYTISLKTMMLEPIADPVYQTKIFDIDGQFYSKKTPLELIKDSCLTQTYSTYEGRRHAIQQKYNIKNNVPIPLDHRTYLCAIPTSSPKRWDCSWIFYGQVERFDSHGKDTKIHFYNKDVTVLKISLTKIKRQYMRTGHLLAKMNLTDLKQTL
ncbi:competence protein ComK [Bacillus manliponensis]|uniref:competence protein ComK n=1 Tax=Bacillus manliponensis TaxID=574376 RepID=UPI003516BD10